MMTSTESVVVQAELSSRVHEELLANRNESSVVVPETKRRKVTSPLTTLPSDNETINDNRTYKDDKNFVFDESQFSITMLIDQSNLLFTNGNNNIIEHILKDPQFIDVIQTTLNPYMKNIYNDDEKKMLLINIMTSLSNYLSNIITK